MLFKKEIWYFELELENNHVLEFIDENIYAIDFELLNKYYWEFKLESKEGSKIILEEVKELSSSALDILDTNNNVFLLKLRKNSKIDINCGNYWNLLSTFPPKAIEKIYSKFLASKLSEEMIDFLIKSKDENPEINLRWDIYCDTNEFKDFITKINKLICLDIRLRIKWNSDFEIKIRRLQEEEDFTKFAKFLIMLWYLSKTNSSKISEMNRRFHFDIDSFIANIKRKVKVSSTYPTQELSILNKAVEEWNKVFEKDKSCNSWKSFKLLKNFKRHMRFERYDSSSNGK